MKINLNNLNPRRVAIQSDVHANHDRDFVYRVRGFKSRHEHLDKIKEDWRLLDSRDILISLGDFALNSTVEEVRSLVNLIPCKTLFLFGNHPSGIKQIYLEALGPQERVLGIEPETFPVEIEYGKFVMGDQFTFSFDHKSYFCSHFASLTWDKMNKGTKALCGHSHGNLKGINPSSSEFGQILDCGVDNALKTVGRTFFWLDEVEEILSRKNVKIWDHH